jgi:hypothetical protein
MLSFGLDAGRYQSLLEPVARLGRLDVIRLLAPFDSTSAFPRTPLSRVNAAEQVLALDRAVSRSFCLIRSKSGGPRRGRPLGCARCLMEVVSGPASEAQVVRLTPRPPATGVSRTHCALATTATDRRDRTLTASIGFVSLSLLA